MTANKSFIFVTGYHVRVNSAPPVSREDALTSKLSRLHSRITINRPMPVLLWGIELAEGLVTQSITSLMALLKGKNGKAFLDAQKVKYWIQ
jgi:hypothetical protein